MREKKRQGGKVCQGGKINPTTSVKNFWCAKILALKSTYVLRRIMSYPKMSIFENFFKTSRRATEASFCLILTCNTALESINLIF